MVVYLIIYKVLAPSQVVFKIAGFLKHQPFFLRYEEVSTPEYIHHLLVLALLGLYAPWSRIWHGVVCCWFLGIVFFGRDSRYGFGCLLDVYGI